ncbi:MAG: transglutaminase-like domain-containing protein [Planctomycetaceae bacterium]|jgi:hypothetical protein|nr:transglutaminase-like domain-containing protein [Planctomycetaceae bacterium]
MKLFHRFLLAALSLLLLSGTQSGCWFRHAADDQTILSAVVSEDSLAAGGEFWSKIQINGIPVGYQHTTVKRLLMEENNEEPALSSTEPKYQMIHDVVTQFRRNNTPMLMTWTLVSNELADGTFLSAAKTEDLMKKTSETVYICDQEKIEKLVKTADRNNFVTTLPLEQGGLGPNAMFFSLLKKPMRVGEKRAFKYFDLMTESYLQLELTASKTEKQQIFQKEVNLLRLDGKLRFSEGSVLTCVYWADARGHIVKNEIDRAVDKWEITMTGASDAKSGFETSAIDPSGKFSLIPVRGKLNHPSAAKKVKYRVQLKTLPAQNGMTPDKLFPSTSSQTVEAVNPQTVDITVTAPGVDQIEPPVSSPLSGGSFQDDLSSNQWIHPENSDIAKIADEIAAQPDTMPRVLAERLRQYVYAKMKNTGVSNISSTASEIVDPIKIGGEMSGGSLEFAIVFASLARRVGLPSRIAVGLLYSQTASGEPFMAFHCWNEVFLGSWIPVDATMESDGNDAARIKLATSNLSGERMEVFLLPVLFSTNNIQVEILESE